MERARLSDGSSSIRTANSSPPRRATRSPSRTSPSIRSVTATRSASPAPWPSVSLTTLKSSRSRKRTAVTLSSGWRVLLGAEHALEGQLEHPAVGRAGQRVALGEVLDVLEQHGIAQVQRGDRRELAEHRRDASLDARPAAGAVLDDDRADRPAVGDHRRDEDVARVGQERREERVARRVEALDRQDLATLPGAADDPVGLARGRRRVGRRRGSRGRRPAGPTRRAARRARSRSARRGPRGRARPAGSRPRRCRAWRRRRRAPAGPRGAGAARAR